MWLNLYKKTLEKSKVKRKEHSIKKLKYSFIASTNIKTNYNIFLFFGISILFYLNEILSLHFLFQKKGTPVKISRFI